MSEFNQRASSQEFLRNEKYEFANDILKQLSSICNQQLSMPNALQTYFNTHFTNSVIHKYYEKLSQSTNQERPNHTDGKPYNGRDEGLIGVSNLKQSTNHQIPAFNHFGFFGVSNLKQSTNHQRPAFNHFGFKPNDYYECNEGLTGVSNFTQNLAVQTASKPFICNVCHKSFSDDSSLKIHYLIHAEKRVSCNVCSKTFAGVYELKRHSSVHSDGDTSFVRSVQQQRRNYERFRAKSDLTAHNSIHYGERPYACDICRKRFNDLNKLRNHFRIHSGEKPYECNVCGIKFAENSNLKRHVRIHSGEKPYVCNECGKRFNQSSSLKSHLNVHAGVKPFNCNVCDKKFVDRSSLRNHVVQHAGEKPHDSLEKNLTVHSDPETNFTKNVSDNCIKELPQSPNQEKPVHNDDKHHDYNECDEGLSNLEQNLAVQTALKLFVCNVCDKSFSDDSSLKKHFLIHGEKKHICKVCGKNFYDILHLKQHLTVHNTEKSYACILCDKRYIHRKSLKKHLSVHSDRNTNSTNNVSDNCIKELPQSTNQEKPVQTDDKHHDYNECDEGLSNLEQNLGVQTSSKLFVCDVCDKSFYNDSSLKNHFLIHVGKKFSCKVCGKKFDEIFLKRHLTFHSREKPHACILCDKRFIHRKSLKKHISVHSDSKRNFTNNVSDNCIKELPQSTNQKKPVHNDDKHHDYNECDEGLSNLEQNLAVQTASKLFVCNVCDKSFSDDPSLKKHFLIHAAKKLICKVCSKKFDDVSSLKKHFLIHAEKKHICKVCSKNFDDILHLRQHLLVHNTEKSYACTLCDKRYFHRKSLMKHLSVHSDRNTNSKNNISDNSIKELPQSTNQEKPVQNDDKHHDYNECDEGLSNLEQNLAVQTASKLFVCNVCDKCFYNDSSLKKHFLIHVGKKFSCKVCGKKFDEILLKRHLTFHSREKPHACILCDKRFIYRRSLKKHISVHSDSKTNFTNNVSDNCIKELPQSTNQENPVHNDDKHHDYYECDEGLPDLKQNLALQTVSKLFVCNVCDKIFSDDSSLKKHSLIHAEKKLICKVCSKNFDDLLHLRQHLAIHNREKSYACILCDKRFTHRKSLKLHVYDHSDSKTNFTNNVSDICINELPQSTNQERPVLVDDKHHDYNECDEGLSNFKQNFTVQTASKLFICTLCDKSFSDDSSLKKHFLIHTEKNLSCKVCSKKFDYFLHLRQHLAVHSREKSYACILCDKRFRQRKGLKKHILVHSDSKTNFTNNVSDICIKELPQSTNQERPVLLDDKHHDYNEYDERLSNFKQNHAVQTASKLFICTLCDDSFSDDSSLKKHFLIHALKRVSCNVCSKNFSCVSDLTRHSKIHSGYKPFVCGVCHRGFHEKWDLTVHSHVHNRERTHACNVCSKKFYTQSTLTYHLRTHSDEKSYECKVCGTKFNNKSNFNCHVRIHTGEKPYVCNECGKRFTQSSTLKTHLNIHAGVKFHCDVCGKTFAGRSSLKMHSVLHTGEKPHECFVCHKRFALAHALKQHFRVHTGERPYICNVCNKRFSKTYNLKVHLRGHAK